MKVIRIYTKMEDAKHTLTEFEVYPGDRIELRTAPKKVPENISEEMGGPEGWQGVSELLLTIHP